MAPSVRRPESPLKPAALPPVWQPWQAAPPSLLAGVVGVMTDIDDTLTREGAIEAAALSALHDLAAAGLPVIAITGRPLGWSRPFAQAWPVAAIVAENGAIALIRDGRRVLTEYAQDEPTRTANALRLHAAAARVLHEVPGARLATDSPGRVTDIAIDHSEFAHLPPEAIAQVVRVLRDEGLTATVSSIHVNGWIGSHSKWTAAQWMVQRLFGRNLQAEAARWVYVGDSTNDQLMFQHLPLTVGVANLRRFADRLQHWPTYITQAERGAGFAEVARALVAVRT
jgi:HAD superfamily hydrolase (TIGR01484 family)